ncbi:hypothetical protein ACJMK2_035939 [Sinanodonta woodiana]|uniref:EF-hand domain-containing protein n=1 Tax=Sinanodonta woodiana TaxID=1069815 RepID=A0ABD3WFL9_SINWO
MMGGTKEKENISGSGERTTFHTNTKKTRSCFRICMFWTVSTIVGLIAVGAGFFYYNLRDPFYVSNEIYESIGQNGVQLFFQHDRNMDGYLSIDEFESVIHRFISSGGNITVDSIGYELPIETEDSIVTVKSFFSPLRLETMTKDFEAEGSMFSFAKPDSISGLKEWKKASIEWMNFGVKHFKVFLPPSEKYITNPENIYHIVKYERNFADMVKPISNNRYYPPRLEEDQRILQRLLNMFHPRPFLINRFAPQGAVACVRAYNQDYIDIEFRLHAEFQLNEPPHYPFWFTPAQFSGNLIISRDYTKILYFNMYVPNNKKLNVDMEWLNGPKENENMEVDIGYMPEMALNITGVSIKLGPENQYIRDIPIPQDPNLLQKVKDIKWSKEITQQEAHRKLEVYMYPFKKVPYYNFTTAVDKARDENKLLHSILLWGSLKNDSTTDPRYAELAKHFLDHYTFPVMMMVSLPNGTIIHKMNANDFLDMGINLLESGFQSPTSHNYWKFLTEGIKKAEESSI